MQLKAELELIARPSPNYGLGNFNLWVYNAIGEVEKQKGFRFWLRKTFGEPPQFYQASVVERSTLILEKYLKDNGYFGASIAVDTIVKKQQMSIEYQVTSKGQFHFANLYYPQDTTPVGLLINQNRTTSLIDTTQYYSKSILDQERQRLTQITGNSGCIDFKEEYLFYLIDTTKKRLFADIHLKIDPSADSVLHQPYYIGKTFAYPAYLLDDSLTTQQNLDTIYRKNLTTIQPIEVVKPKTLERAIAQTEGDLVNEELQDISVNHLLDLGLFKFVRLKYQKRDSINQQFLDRYFYLTPSLTQNIQYEFQVNNRSGGFLGSEASVQYSHNNLFKGAESFSIKLSGGFETQLQNNQSFINTIDLTLEANLLIAKLLLPFKFRNRYSRFVPRTRFSISNNFQRRTNFYTINAATVEVGYEWKQNRKKRHEFSALRINELNVSDKSDSFKAILADDLRLNNSFNNVFILSSNYIFTYNSIPKTDISSYSFFKLEVGTAGNMLSLVDKSAPTGENANQFLGLTYAQFFKISPDYRYYFPRRNNELASRILFGFGLPYGNSVELPYIEQFFVGGSNSIRAFPLRGLGPGSFFDETITNNDDQLIDQTGDIKLEFNLEYRFDIVQYLEGAVFLDGGNVWLLESEGRPEGIFKFDQFYKEIALGTGFGIRLNFDFFIIRLDAAFPLRRPISNGQFDWTFNDLAIYKRSWRQENLVYNLAIGYPF